MKRQDTIIIGSNGAPSGISPLNRRFSERIQQKRFASKSYIRPQLMDLDKARLLSEDTVVMQSATPTKNLRWDKWRPMSHESELSSITAKKDHSIMDFDQPPCAIQAFSRLPTTRRLQSMFKKTNISENSSPSRTRLKRKHTVSSGLPQTLPKKKLKVSLSSKDSVFKSSHNKYLRFVDAPITWRVKFEPFNRIGHVACAFYIDNNHCLIANENGTVIELDEAVEHCNTYNLPSSVSTFGKSNDAIVSVSANGMISEICDGNIKYVDEILNQNKVLSSHFDDNLIALVDTHGTIWLYSLQNNQKTKIANDRPSSFVYLDQGHVYLGHSEGVIKYSLDGNVIWSDNLSFPKAITSSSCGKNILVCNDQEIFKLNKFSGAKTTYTFTNYEQIREDSFTSIASGDSTLFVSGTNLYCFDENELSPLYFFKTNFTSHTIKYFSGRIFMSGIGQFFAIDLTRESLLSVEAGEKLSVTNICLDSNKIKKFQCPVRRYAKAKRLRTKT